MVGQGVLRECLLDPSIDAVQTIGRSETGVVHAKLRNLVRADLTNYSDIEADLCGFDACFYCLGVASAGLDEAQYERMTFGLALAAAESLARLNPTMNFVFVSGAGADSSEKGSLMWARIKGKTENALLRLPFKAAYVFRPALVQPANGERSKTAWYRVFYGVTGPILPLFRRMFPRYLISTEEIGLAMIQVAKSGAPKKILESLDIRALCPTPHSTT